MTKYFKNIFIILLLFFPCNIFANQTATPTKNTLNKAPFDNAIATKKLLSVVENCAFKADTNHYVFKGCVDWHSSVHGYWALLWGAYVLNNKALANEVLQRLNPQDLAKELSFLKQQDKMGTTFEMPYGRAWFLQLAHDAESFYGTKSLRPLANYVYASLIDFAKHNGGSILSTNYDNASWYLYQTYQWAKYINDEKEQKEIKRIVLNRFNKKILWPKYSKINGFFDPKTMAALLLANVAPNSDVFKDLLKSYSSENLIPIFPPFKTAHCGGLNFSRAWGLISLYQVTKNPKFLNAYYSHVNLMLLTLPEWSADYRRYAHWVGQFGLFALRTKLVTDEHGYTQITNSQQPNINLHHEEREEHEGV